MSTQDSSSTDDTNSSAPRKRRRMRALLFAVLVFAVAGGAWYAYDRLIGQYYVSTDDAYVHGDRVPVSPQVSGTVIGIQARDTDYVRQGQVLVRLDPADARLALAKAESALALQVRSVRQDYARVDALDATVQMDRAQLAQAKDDFARQQRLRQRGMNSQEQFQHAQTAEQVARAKLALDQAQLAGARAAVGGTKLEDNPAIRQAAAAVRSAYLALQRTRILAPVSGYVANRGVQVGQQVKPGSVLMDVVPLADVWVNANFKESELSDVRIGQPVSLQADFYGNAVTYHGKVLGLSPGTGSAFALLPAQNATGNWIKVVQRLPVRIGIPAGELRKHPLRLGLSMSVTVDTHDRSGASLTTRKTGSQPSAASGVYSGQLTGARKLVRRIIAENRGDAVPAHGGS
ncbi:efflux RND transporter periplasmic adaptor subunit [Acidihalobacter prosperus]